MIAPRDVVNAVLERLLSEAELKAVLLVSRSGQCIAWHGDQASMEVVAETHFQNGFELGALCRDAYGSTVLSESSGEAVRLESVGAGRCILTLVSADPMAPMRMRGAIDRAKDEIEVLLSALAE